MLYAAPAWRRPRHPAPQGPPVEGGRKRGGDFRCRVGGDVVILVIFGCGTIGIKGNVGLDFSTNYPLAPWSSRWGCAIASGFWLRDENHNINLPCGPFIWIRIVLKSMKQKGCTCGRFDISFLLMSCVLVLCWWACVGMGWYGRCVLLFLLDRSHYYAPEGRLVLQAID